LSPKAPAPLAVVAALLLAALPSDASADWLLTPFLGGSFAPETTFLIFEEGAGRSLAFGGSVALLSDGIFGLEADVGYTPGFFQGDDPLGLVLSSRVTTVAGSVILAVPLTITRESLRPYFVGGLGLLQARSKHVAGVLNVYENLLGVSIGGGAIGMVTPQTGLRFDVRYFNAASGPDGPFARPGLSSLSFWRGTAGLVLRLP
jgi:hypothetical protein